MLDIIFGVIISFIFAFTIGQVMVIFFGNSGLVNKFGWLSTVLPILIFVALCFAWIKTKKIIVKGGIILALLATYFLGRIYALDTYKSANDASTLYKEAYFASGMAAASPNDSQKFLDAERKYVALVKEASEKPKGAMKEVRVFYAALYGVAKEFLDYDERLFSGQLVASQDEVNKIGQDLQNKKLQIMEQGYPFPYDWPWFFRVK